MKENIWEIIDDNGVIHSGTEQEMKLAFDVMSDPCFDEVNKVGSPVQQQEAKALIDKYLFTGWKGDLKLIEVHKITR